MEVYLEKYGTALTTEKSSFLIQTEDDKQLLSPEKIQVIHIGAFCRMSTEAILLAIEHDIDVQFLDRKGFPQGRVWSNRFGSISTIRRNQIAFTRSQAGWDWIRTKLADRIEGQMGILLAFQDNDVTRNQLLQNAVSRLNSFREKIQKVVSSDFDQLAPTLRGWEGNAARIYFDSIQLYLPIAYHSKERSRRPAKDIFNALLNYAFGMLYGKVEAACIKAGIDPCLGILHRDDYNRPAWVYDMIESYRIWAEFVVIDLCRQDVLYPECFSQNLDGFWLEQDGRRILIQCFRDYLDEVIPMKGITRSREMHIQLEAHALAQTILQFSE
jgi:CRISP-associated protein Cas1